MTTATAGRPATGFRFHIPDSWIDYDLGNLDLTDRQAQLRRAATDDAQRRSIDETFRQARRLIRSARRQGAMSAAGTIGMFDDGLLMAFMVVFGITTPAGEEMSVRTLTAQLSRPSGPNGVGDRTVTAVELPGIGRVARITGTEMASITDDLSFAVVAMHTIIPIPGQPDSYLIMSGMSPNLPLAGEVLDIFDAITGTFRFAG